MKTTARPTTFLNWKGEHVPAYYPKGTLLVQCGNVFLIKTGKNYFAVVYCLEVNTGLSRSEAANHFGEACLHQVEN